MTTIPQGYTPLISPYGSWISFGYERAGAWHVSDPTDQRLATSPGGAIYPCGWFDDTLMAFERPAGTPGAETVELWSFDLSTRATTLTNYPPWQWPGHNQLPVIDGLVFSYVPPTKHVYYETADITPPGQTVEGPQWDGRHWLYQDSQSVTSDGTAWKTYVRRVTDTTILFVLDVPLLYAKPYDVSGLCWVTGWQPGVGVRVWNPEGAMQVMPNEGVGPVTLDGTSQPIAVVWTCISTTWGEPKGVFGRLWSDFTPTSLGWWVEGIWHQGLTVKETSEGWLVSGFRQDTGEQRTTLVAYTTQRVPLPTWTAPGPDPGPEPEPEPEPGEPLPLTLLASTLAGRAPLVVQLTAWDYDVFGPGEADDYVWWAKHERGDWQKLAETATAQATVVLPFVGTYGLHVDRPSDANTSSNTTITVLPSGNGRPPEQTFLYGVAAGVVATLLVVALVLALT